MLSCLLQLGGSVGRDFLKLGGIGRLELLKQLGKFGEIYGVG